MDEHLSEFATSLATLPAEDLFGELHSLFDKLAGVSLFTCSRFDLAAGQAERIYTSNAEAYPLSGVKEIIPNRWTQIVLTGRAPFLSETIEGLRDVFPDHEKIEELGLGAAINLPVFVSGRMLGTANLLAPDHAYSQRTLDDIAPISLCLSLAFMAHALEAAQRAGLTKLTPELEH